MALKEFIQRCLEQNHESLVRSVEGLSQRELSWRPDPQSMSIGFLVWHYGRTLDRWIHTRVLESLQLWEQGWASQFEQAPPTPATQATDIRPSSWGSSKHLQRQSSWATPRWRRIKLWNSLSGWTTTSWNKLSWLIPEGAISLWCSCFSN